MVKNTQTIRRQMPTNVDSYYKETSSFSAESEFFVGRTSHKRKLDRYEETLHLREKDSLITPTFSWKLH